MKLGLCSVTFRDKNSQEILDLIKDTPIQAIEWAGDSHAKPESSRENLSKVRQASQESGIEISSYGAYYQAGQGQDFLPVLKVAKTLGTKDIRIWAGAMDFDKGYEDIDEAKRERIIKDVKAVCQAAAKEGVRIHLEHHKWTYTDTTKASRHLLEAINEDNCFLYWQPPMEGTVSDKLEDIEALGPWISNVHVFHWSADFERYPLSAGKEAWRSYIDALEAFPYANRTYLLEFVKADSEEQLKADVDLLQALLK